MSPTPTELTEDPLFQLNVLLWLSQPLPEGSDIVPILHQQGFGVYAIAPRLAVPLDLRLAAQHANVAVQDAARPDVVLAREGDGRFALAECKRSSFGPASDTAEQARAFLLIAGPRAAEVLGLTSAQVRDSIQTYLLPEHQRNGLQATLEELTRTLASRRLPGAQFAILGLGLSEDALMIMTDSAGSMFYSLPQPAHKVMRLQANTDPRPLYFIPYDPDVDLSSRERIFCKRLLFERLQASVLVAIGRAVPPVELRLEINGLLNDAMFGMYALWENRDSARHMRQLCRQLMMSLSQAINTVAGGSVTYEPGRAWKVNMEDADQHERVTDAVTRFSCATLELRMEPEADLFDKP